MYLIPFRPVSDTKATNFPQIIRRTERTAMAVLDSGERVHRRWWTRLPQRVCRPDSHSKTDCRGLKSEFRRHSGSWSRWRL